MDTAIGARYPPARRDPTRTNGRVMPWPWAKGGGVDTAVVLSPHVAAGTRDAIRTKMRAIADNVGRMLAGEPLRHAVAEAASAAMTA